MYSPSRERGIPCYSQPNFSLLVYSPKYTLNLAMALVVRKETKAPTYLSTALDVAHTVYGVAKHLWNHRENLVSVGNKIYSYVQPGSNSSSSSSSRGKGRIRMMNSGDNSSYSFSKSPVAENVTLRNTTYWHEQSLPRHVEFGECIRITGRQALTDAVTTSTTSQLFSGSGHGVNSVLLSPDQLGSRLALIARTYDKYAFRYIKVYYYPRVATSQAGGFGLAYVQDGAVSDYATLSYTTLQQITPCVLTAFRESASLEFVYEGNSVWFCEDDGTGLSEKRLTRQGFISGFPDASSIGDITMGHFIVEYVCDLYQPICDLGFTVTLSTQMEKDYVLKQLEIYRLKNPPPYRVSFDDYVKALEGKETPSPSDIKRTK